MLRGKKRRLCLILLACVTACLVVPCVLVGRIWLHAQVNQELVNAVERHDALAVEASLQRGADPNTHIQPPGTWMERLKRVFFSKTADDVDTPTVLVENLLGTKDESDNVSDHPDITRSLLQHGADANLKGWGWTPINAAASMGMAQSVKLLLDKGADANAGAGTEFPALFYAQVTPEIAGLMLAHGANVNMRDKEGKTPLEYTLIRRYPSSLALAQVFLDHGADVTLKDERGQSPLSLAAQSPNAAAEDSWYNLLQHYANKQRQ